MAYNFGFRYGQQNDLSGVNDLSDLARKVKEQQMFELQQMKAWALNGRPDGAEVLGSVADPRSGGAMIANQMAYDRNMAAVHNPIKAAELLTKGTADVGGPKRKMKGSTAGTTLDEDIAGRKVAQYEIDHPWVKDERRLAMLEAPKPQDEKRKRQQDFFVY